MGTLGRWMWVVGWLVTGCLAVGWLAVPVAAQDNAECLDCHADPDLLREGEHRPGTSVYVSEEMGLGSVHEDWACVDCHVGVDVDHDWEALPPADCAGCHEDAADAVAGSLHGRQAAERGATDVPTCVDCHGGHDIRYVDDPESPAYRTNVPLTCAECHADPSFNERRPLARVSPLAGYEQSVHFTALQADENGATCTDCHEYHDLLRPNDPRSAIHDQNVPATCGQCHGEIQAVFERSIHGQALAAGELDSPDCVDCHGEHEIRGPDDPESMVYPSHVAETTCVWCHESERIVKRFGLAEGRRQTFADSYHGLAESGGSTTVANCASCHGIHDILPSSEPASMVHPDNLAATCGQCHPGAGARFAIGTVHVAPGVDNGEHAFVYWARVLYVWLIVGVVGMMAAHNGLDFVRKGRAPRLPRGRAVLRFTVGERWQHGIMAGSFLVLAYSGFALKFPDAWWATPFGWAGNGEVVRQWVHRTGALAMVAVCLAHLVYVVATRRGRGQLAAMRPRWQDAKDAAHMVGWYFNRRPDRPGFDRYGYIEKLEYWALVWGSIVMSVTGFALWFENQSLALMPLWMLDLATVVHYYEAWLATLAIVVWHFYWVMFNPEIYPMSKVWLDGWLSEEEMRHEHPKEWERLQRGEGGGAS
jgi:cytochrome b subunit of formate dehydrogenase/nitrate/TMAO reductase-like tetraheme cytochrome c subunit